MGRPGVLTRQRVAVVALGLLDAEGLEALSVERIARELGVRGPSIYHHFTSKAEILREVAHMVMGDLDLRRTAADWQSWMVGVCLTFYRRVLEHPRSAVILLEHLPEMATIPALGATSRFLTGEGVNPALQLLVIEGTEKITWGWSLRRAMEATTGIALPERDEADLEEALRAFIDGVELRDHDWTNRPSS
jgi:TetR/AcrR family transcriptional regulator, tetracycline repressor protein